MLGTTNVPALIPESLSISLNGTNSLTYDGTSSKSLNITAASVGAAAASHNHDSVYAKVSHTHTKAQITDFPTSLPNAGALTISLNGTSQGAYNGSAAKAINITASSVGAAAASHTHNYAGSSSAGGNANAAVKLATARKIGNASFDGTADITVSAIGAAAASHTHSYLPLSGGTMTAGVETRGTDISVYDNVAMFTSASTSIKGTLKITMPVAFTSTMMNVYVSVYNYLAGTHADLIISLYNYGDNKSFSQLSCYCTNTTLVNKVRVAFDGSKCCILLGTVSTTWAYPKVVVGKVIAGFNNSTLFRTGWNISLVTAETDYSAIQEITINGGLISQSTRKLATARKIGNIAFDGTADITVAQIGAAAASHNHDSVYAKLSHNHTKSQITDFPASLKNPTALTISLNGTSQGAYDGSAAKSINITAASVGAAAASHTHNYAGSSSAGGNANAAVKLATARKIGNIAFDGTTDITIAQIGAAAASHNHDSVYAKLSHTHTKSQITDFPASLPANGGTADYAKYLKSNLIPNDSDLNNYMTPGFYYCPSNASAATLKNCPTGNAFFLIVGTHAGFYQHIVEYMTSSPKNFFRNKYETTWSSWFREYTTVNKPTLAELGAAATSHTHTKSQISDFPASLKNPTAMVVKLNGGTTEGTNMFTYDGSTAKSLNITAALVGAAASSHTHNYAGSSSAGGSANAAVKLATARKIGNVAFDGTADITVAQIGAAAASHTHTKAQITDFPASLKNPSALTISLAGTSQGAYDGSAAKAINITAAAVKAAPVNLIFKAVTIKVADWNTTSKKYEYANASITANHSPMVNFNKATLDAAGKAGIIVYTEAGKLVFEYTTIPTVDLVIDAAILIPV